MTAAATQAASEAEITLAYHMRTKHSLERYAAGPETLDWDTQPNPFREFAGVSRVPLVLRADSIETGYAQIYAPEGATSPALTINEAAALLELSMGLSAWKEYGPDRWALRCNPSSGNLHPTEAYLFACGIPGLADGLYHYVSRDHVLELRCATKPRPGAAPGLWIGLSSVHWREAWKYGERAFRYCQLDAGHALGAVRYAAGALGLTARLIEDIDSRDLAALMGLDRAADFAGAEPEDAEALVSIGPELSERSRSKAALPFSWHAAAGERHGRASLLDPYPMYRWPVIHHVGLSTQGHGTGIHSAPFSFPPLLPAPQARASSIILGRRSAQRFDSKFCMSAESFYRMLDCVLSRPLAPWDLWSFAPAIHLVLFIHRVEGLEPGLYVLPRTFGGESLLRQELRPDFLWQKPEPAPAHLPFMRLASADCRAVARTVSCHQAIASDSCFSLAMLSEFELTIKANPWRYRQLHWEAGLLGQVLYLEAEAQGLKGTGIGCFFDDAVHELLGIKSGRLQSLYHFTVGRGLTDNRITTLPAYPGRQRTE